MCFENFHGFLKLIIYVFLKKKPRASSTQLSNKPVQIPILPLWLKTVFYLSDIKNYPVDFVF